MRKSRTEILRGKLLRMGESDLLHPDMPDDVADAFIAHLRFDPDCGAIAARAWRPDHRNEEPWIRKLLADQPRLRERARAQATRTEEDSDGSDESIN